MTPVSKNSTVSFVYGKKLVQVAEYFIFSTLFFLPLSKKKKKNLQREKNILIHKVKMRSWKYQSFRPNYLNIKWKTIKACSVVIWIKHWSGALLRANGEKGTCELISWLIWRDNLTKRLPTAMWNSYMVFFRHKTKRALTTVHWLRRTGRREKNCITKVTWLHDILVSICLHWTLFKGAHQTTGLKGNSEALILVPA